MKADEERRRDAAAVSYSYADRVEREEFHHATMAYRVEQARERVIAAARIFNGATWVVDRDNWKLARELSDALAALDRLTEPKP